MKKILILLLLVLAGCSDFQRTYDNVNEEFPRILSLYFIEPDIAPGDTVTVRTVWGGQKLVPSQVQWDVSWQISSDIFGGSSASSREPLDSFIISELAEVSNTEFTQVFEMQIKIPEDVILNSPNIPEQWTDLLRPYGIIIDTEALGIPADKTGLLEMLDSLSNLPEEIKAQIPVDLGYQLEGLCQFAVAEFQLHCDYTAAGGFEGQIKHRIRYQSDLEAIPGVFTNNQPAITGWRIFEVEGDPYKFYSDSGTALDTFSIVQDSVSFSYSDSKSYFLEVDIDQRDSTITNEQVFSGDALPSFEQFDGYWFYDDSAFVSIGMIQQEDLTDQIVGRGRMIFKLNFGEKPVKNMPLHFWFEMNDYRFGTGLRPIGVDFRELDITLL